jgi:choline dehydrogenase-like flavoprotein
VPQPRGENLFVVDGGPFPTGTGINPTLTIMANAWRVAEHIADGRNTTRSSKPLTS